MGTLGAPCPQCDCIGQHGACIHPCLKVLVAIKALKHVLEMLNERVQLVDRQRLNFPKAEPSALAVGELGPLCKDTSGLKQLEVEVDVLRLIQNVSRGAKRSVNISFFLDCWHRSKGIITAR